MANYVLDHTGQQVNTKLTKAENIDNKVTSISSSSTNTQYPSAKAVYDIINNKRKLYTATSVRASNASGTSPTKYIPGKWLITTGTNPTEGDTYLFAIPSAGTSAGVYLSVNGTADNNYYPILVGGTSILTTHYAVGIYIEIIYESSCSSTSNTYALNGADNKTEKYTGGAFRVLNYYDSGNTNTLQRIYASSSNVEFPLVGQTNGTTTTSALAITSSNRACYGAVPATASNKATINASTGKITIPSGLILGTSSSKLGNIVFRNSTNAYTTTINSGVPTANKTITLPAETGTLALLNSPAFTGTPTAPTATAGTNTTQVATTAFVQTALAGYTLTSQDKADIATLVIAELDGNGVNY